MSRHPQTCGASVHLAELFAPGLSTTTFHVRAARILREVADCQVVSFAELEPATRRLAVDFDPYSPELAVALAGFGLHMAHYPCFNFDPSVNGGRPFLRGDFLSDAEFYASPIYLEGFKLAGITDHAAVHLPSPDRKVFFLGLEKRDGRTFTAEHRRRLTTLQPHLANARQLALSFSALESTVANPAAFCRAGFTPREAEVLALLVAGKSNPETALALGISLPTVKSHVTTIFNKLGVDNRHAALLRACELARASVSPASAVTELAQVSACAPARGNPFGVTAAQSAAAR